MAKDLPTMKIRKLVEPKRCENLNCCAMVEPPYLRFQLNLRIQRGSKDSKTYPRTVILCEACNEVFSNLNGFNLELV